MDILKHIFMQRCLYNVLLCCPVSMTWIRTASTFQMVNDRVGKGKKKHSIGKKNTKPLSPLALLINHACARISPERLKTEFILRFFSKNVGPVSASKRRFNNRSSSTILVTYWPTPCSVRSALIQYTGFWRTR